MNRSKRLFKDSSLVVTAAVLGLLLCIGARASSVRNDIFNPLLQNTTITTTSAASVDNFFFARLTKKCKKKVRIGLKKGLTLSKCKTQCSNKEG